MVLRGGQLNMTLSKYDTSGAPIAGSSDTRTSSIISTAETTASSTYTTLATPDQVSINVGAKDIVRVRYKAQWKISVSSGVQTASFFLNGVQLKSPKNAGAPTVTECQFTSLATFYSHLVSTGSDTQGGLASTIGATADVTDVTTGQMLGFDHSTSSAGNTASVPGPFEIHGLAAGAYTLSVQFKTTANTLSVRNRSLWVEVVTFP